MSGQILLLVHPDDDVRSGLASALGEAGHRVMAVSSSSEAWQRVQEVLKPDVLVAHLDEEEEEEPWIGARLRQNADSASTPIVVLAADRRRALRQGYVNVAAEPADPEEVVLLVHLALDQRQEDKGLAGDLEKMSIPDLMQTVSAGARSGRITVESGKLSGTMWARDGRVIHAAIKNGPSGRDAAFEMIGWTAGTFSVKFGPVTIPETISDSTPFLLLEAMRLRDEANRQAPPGHAGLPDEPPQPTREETAIHLGLLLLNVTASWMSDRLRTELLSERLEKERLVLLGSHPFLERFEVDPEGARIALVEPAVPEPEEVEPLVSAVCAWLRGLFEEVDRALPGRFSLDRLSELTEAHEANLADLGYSERLGWKDLEKAS